MDADRTNAGFPCGQAMYVKRRVSYRVVVYIPQCQVVRFFAEDLLLYESEDYFRIAARYTGYLSNVRRAREKSVLHPEREVRERVGNGSPSLTTIRNLYWSIHTRAKGVSKQGCPGRNLANLVRLSLFLEIRGPTHHQDRSSVASRSAAVCMGTAPRRDNLFTRPP